jgi:hypothetical protein
MQILIDNLSVEAINAALLRIQRSFKDNQASLTSNVNKIVSNTSGVSSKYDDTALRNEISALQAILFQVQQSDENQNKRLDDHEEQIDENVQNIAVLQNLMSNIKFEYDIDTNTITFTSAGTTKKALQPTNVVVANLDLSGCKYLVFENIEFRAADSYENTARIVMSSLTTSYKSSFVMFFNI